MSSSSSPSFVTSTPVHGTPTVLSRSTALSPVRRRHRPASRCVPRSTLAPPLPPPSAVPAPSLEPDVLELRSTSDFVRLQRACTAEDCPLVLLFHASHCRACKVVLPKFRALANQKKNVTMATVLYSDAKELSMRLGVARVPIVQVYQAGDGKVDEFACGLKSLDKLRYTLDMLDQGTKYVRKET